MSTIAEIAAKENVKSGFPLNAPPAKLHRKLVSCICETPDIPLDVFEKGEVVREERYCVSAYCFYCNGTASYTYEAGNVRQHKTAIDLGDRTRVETENYMEWTQMSGSANVSATLFTSGNRTVAAQIQKLYMFLDPTKLHDLNELGFPDDVVAYDYNLPQAASFNEYVKPYVERLLKEKATDALKGKNTRNLSLGGGSRIDKDEVVNVFLGLYRIVFKYGDKEYPVWVTGDGEKAFHEGMPVDTQRQKTLNEKKAAMEEERKSIQKPKTGLMNFFKWVCIILGGAFLLAFLGSLGGGDDTVILSMALVAVLAITGAILLGIKRSKKWKAYNSADELIKSKHQQGIDDFEAEVNNMLNQFKSQKKALRGVYESVSGDASAF